MLSRSFIRNSVPAAVMVALLLMGVAFMGLARLLARRWETV